MNIQERRIRHSPVIESVVGSFVGCKVGSKVGPSVEVSVGTLVTSDFWQVTPSKLENRFSSQEVKRWHAFFELEKNQVHSLSSSQNSAQLSTSHGALGVQIFENLKSFEHVSFGSALRA
jgi:hypothetical protein